MARAWFTPPVVLEIPTPRGLARAHLHLPGTGPDGGPTRTALVLGHGAGGSITAPDLQAVTARAVADGVTVALIEQPYRVAGRRSAPPAPHLDEAWVAVMTQLRAGPLAGLQVVCGGRSSGARVACRTALAVGAAAVLCLAFPLQPPPRKSGPAPSRQDELDAAGVPVLVVQGENDRFGVPASDPARGREVVVVSGDHGLKKDVVGTAAIVADWLGRTGLR